MDRKSVKEFSDILSADAKARKVQAGAPESFGPTTPDTLRPGYYLCMSPAGIPHLREYGHDIWCDNEGQIRKDPRTLGYTIHYLPDLLGALAEVSRLRKRLAEEIHWGHLGCTPKNCTSSGIECPAATPAGEEGEG